MKLHNRCGEPPAEARAISNPDMSLKKYGQEIEIARRWLGVELSRLAPQADPLHLNTLRVFYGSVSAASWLVRAPASELPPTTPDDVELARRQGLGILAMAKLIMQEPGIDLDIPKPPPSGVPDKKMSTLIDLGNEPSLETWEDYRLHIHASSPNLMPSNETDQWYREGDLWIRQINPAAPTDFVAHTFLPAIKAPSLAGHGTLIPYVVTK